MSDPAPDPIDKTYADAEAAMSDEAARAARRARVLAAVAGAPTAASPLARRPSVWRRGGWLVAASIAGLGLFIATQIYQPPPHVPPAAATKTAPAPILAPPRTPPPSKAAAGIAPTRPPVVAAPPEAAPPLPVAPPVVLESPPPPPVARAVAPEPRAFPAEAPPPPPAEVAAGQPAPAAAANQPQSAAGAADKSAETNVSDLVVVAGKREEREQSVPVAVSAFTSSKADQAERRAQAASAARLRAAAAAGNTAEVESLLGQGVPVDAPDAKGDTALIKSIEADQPATAALLVQHGASPDHRNHAGKSARDLARAKGAADLNDALGPSP